MDQPSAPPPRPDPPPRQEGARGTRKKIKLQHDPAILSEGQRGANRGYFLEQNGRKCRGCDRGVPFSERVDQRIKSGSIGEKTLKQMKYTSADIYEWCCALCPQHDAYNEQRQEKKPQLRHGRCCVRAPLTDGNRFPSANNRHLGNPEDTFRVGTDREHWYKEPSQGTDENVPSASNLDQIIIDEDAQSSTPSPNSPQPLLPHGNFDDGPEDFANVVQEEVAWPESDTSPTASYQ